MPIASVVWRAKAAPYIRDLQLCPTPPPYRAYSSRHIVGTASQVGRGFIAPSMPIASVVWRRVDGALKPRPTYAPYIRALQLCLTPPSVLGSWHVPRTTSFVTCASRTARQSANARLISYHNVPTHSCSTSRDSSSPSTEGTKSVTFSDADARKCIGAGTTVSPKASNARTALGM